MKLLAIIFFISQCRNRHHDLNRWTLNSDFRSGHWAQRVVPLLVIMGTLWLNHLKLKVNLLNFYILWLGYNRLSYTPLCNDWIFRNDD